MNTQNLKTNKEKAIEELYQAIQKSAERAWESFKADDAMKFTQAAGNAANAIRTLADFK